MAKRKSKHYPKPPSKEIPQANVEQTLAEDARSTTKPVATVPAHFSPPPAPTTTTDDSASASVSPPPYPPSFPPTNIRLPDQKSIQYAAPAPALMPMDATRRKTLEARALLIAKPAAQQQYEQRNQYLRFRLGAVEQYGIPYPYLEELRYVGNLARVPCTPKFIAGVVNHRGELLTILDLKQFFQMPALEQAHTTRIIVVKHAGVRVGLLVDEVDGNAEYQNNELAPPLGSDGVSNMEYVLGIHAGRITLLNVAALLNDPALRVAH